MPRFAGDELPKSLVASAVALADKFDTLTGIFGIGQHQRQRRPICIASCDIRCITYYRRENLPLDLEDLVKNQPHFWR